MTPNLDSTQASPTAIARPLDTHRLLKTREAAEALTISPRTLWSLTVSGEIPSVRHGRCLRYLERDLVAWIQKHRVARR